jgi:hypothetical protein
MRRIVPILFYVLLSACGEDDLDIGSGYRYFELDGGNYAIVDRNNLIVVDPNVTRYVVMDSYIFGEREKPSLIDDPRFSRKFGYFILDMRNGEYVEGLDEVGFRSALGARNLEFELLGRP